MCYNRAHEEDDEDVPAGLPDPFEESEQAPPPLVPLTGNTYAVKEALKALGARWDGERRAWLIREDKAPHARALIENQPLSGRASLPGGRSTRQGDA